MGYCHEAAWSIVTRQMRTKNKSAKKVEELVERLMRSPAFRSVEASYAESYERTRHQERFLEAVRPERYL